VSGQYASVTDNTPFVDFQLGEDANNIFLDTIKNAVQFPDIARTRNQKAVAGVLQGLSAGNPIFDAAVMLDVPHALRAFDLLSGEIHATIRGMLLDESRFPREAIIGRLRQSVGGGASIFAPQLATLNYAADDGDEAALAYAGRRPRPRHDIDLLKPQPPAAAGPVLTAWGQAFGNWGHAAGDGNAASYDRTIGGFLTGLDQTSADQGGGLWRFGFAGGYQHTSIGIDDRNSSGGVATYHLAAYAGTQQGPFGVRLGTAYSWHDINASRTIAFPGFSDATQARYDAHTAQVFGEVGYAMTQRGVAFEPFAALAHVAIRTAAFTENGGAAALTGPSDSIDATFSTLGLRAAAPLPWPGAAGLMAKGSIGWRHAFGSVTPTAELALVSSGTPFGIAGAPIARDAAAIELGLDGRIARDATLGIAYAGQLASNSRDNGITANFVQRF
jgi:outer membrane autotransporter protein